MKSSLSTCLAMSFQPELETVKEVILSKLITFLVVSVTVIMQFVKLPSLKENNVIVVFPEIAEVVLDELELPYVIFPASEDENV